MEHGAAKREALLPSAGESAGDEIFLPFEVGHLERPLDALFEFCGGHAIKAGEETQIFDDLEIVIEGELLRHVADVLADGFGVRSQVQERGHDHVSGGAGAGVEEED